MHTRTSGETKTNDDGKLLSTEQYKNDSTHTQNQANEKIHSQIIEIPFGVSSAIISKSISISLLSLSLRLAISTLIWSNGIAFAYLQLDCGAIIFIYLPYALDLSWAPKISLIWSSLFLSIPEYALCSQSPVCVLSHWLWKTPLSIQRHYFLSWSGILLYIYFLWLFTAWLDWWIRRWRFDPGAVWSSHMSPVWRKFR